MKIKAWDIVSIENHTDLYRVYSFNGGFILCGLNSDTVRKVEDVKVTEVKS